MALGARATITVVLGLLAGTRGSETDVSSGEPELTPPQQYAAMTNEDTFVVITSSTCETFVTTADQCELHATFATGHTPGYELVNNTQVPPGCFIESGPGGGTIKYNANLNSPRNCVNNKCICLLPRARQTHDGSNALRLHLADRC